MGSHSLLQGIFLTQGSNLGLLLCRQTLYRLSHQGSPKILPRKINLHSDLAQGSVFISVRVNFLPLHDGKENTINQKPGKWLLFLHEGLRAGLWSCHMAHSAAAWPWSDVVWRSPWYWTVHRLHSCHQGPLLKGPLSLLRLGKVDGHLQVLFCPPSYEEPPLHRCSLVGIHTEHKKLHSLLPSKRPKHILLQMFSLLIFQFWSS